MKPPNIRLSCFTESLYEISVANHETQLKLIFVKNFPDLKMVVLLFYNRFSI